MARPRRCGACGEDGWPARHEEHASGHTLNSWGRHQRSSGFLALALQPWTCSGNYVQRHPPFLKSVLSFTALARLAAMAGDGKRALALGEELVSQGVPPKLRNFTPALHAFAAHRQVGVQRLMRCGMRQQSARVTRINQSSPPSFSGERGARSLHQASSPVAEFDGGRLQADHQGCLWEPPLGKHAVSLVESKGKGKCCWPACCYTDLRHARPDSALC